MAETGPKVSENNSVPFIVQHRLVVWRKCAEAVGWPIVSIQSGESLILFFFTRFRRVVRDGRKYLDPADQADELPLSFYVFWPSES